MYKRFRYKASGQNFIVHTIRLSIFWTHVSYFCLYFALFISPRVRIHGGQEARSADSSPRAASIYCFAIPFLISDAEKTQELMWARQAGAGQDPRRPGPGPRACLRSHLDIATPRHAAPRRTTPRRTMPRAQFLILESNFPAVTT